MAHTFTDIYYLLMILITLLTVVLGRGFTVYVNANSPLVVSDSHGQLPACRRFTYQNPIKHALLVEHGDVPWLHQIITGYPHYIP